MKKLAKVLLMIACLAPWLIASAQTLELEKTYEISKAAKKGTLDYVKYDPEAELYELNYVTKSNDKKARFEIYLFDKEFNFVEMFEEEIEFEKARQKYKWFRFRGDYEATALTVENNLAGQVVLKQGAWVTRYDWYNGVYWTSFDVMNKEKPRDEEDRRMTMLTYRTDAPQESVTYFGWSWLYPKTKTFSDLTGDVSILTSVIPKVFKDTDPLYMYAVQRWDANELTLKAEEQFEFDHPQTPVYTGVLENGDFAAVFAPMGGPGTKKTADPNPLNWTYVQANSLTCEIVARKSFTSPASYWDIHQITLLEDGDIYIYGEASDKSNDKYYNLQIGKSKATGFILAKVVDGETKFVNMTALEEFEQKLKAPPSQKKAVAYKGKRFQLGGIQELSNGDIMISGQNYKDKEDGRQFLDIMVFHFNGKGELKAQYGLDVEEKNKWAKSVFTESLFWETPNGKEAFWIIMEVAGMKSGMFKETRALNYARVGKVDLDASTVGDFVSLGQEKGNTFYLENSFPILPLNEENKIVFFGSDKGGRVLWFARMPME